MSIQKFIAHYNGMFFSITEDNPEIGFYLYAFKEDGRSFFDSLQESVQFCKEVAHEDFEVPFKKWLKLDEDLGRYIISYYHNLLNKNEQEAFRHLNTDSKMEVHNVEEGSPRHEVYKNQGWISEKQEVVKLVKMGGDDLSILVAERVLIESFSQVFINNCPKCGKLARTPQAKQCRHCSSNWH